MKSATVSRVIPRSQLNNTRDGLDSVSVSVVALYVPLVSFWKGSRK